MATGNATYLVPMLQCPQCLMSQQKATEPASSASEVGGGGFPARKDAACPDGTGHAGRGRRASVCRRVVRHSRWGVPPRGGRGGGAGTAWQPAPNTARRVVKQAFKACKCSVAGGERRPPMQEGSGRGYRAGRQAGRRVVWWQAGGQAYPQKFADAGGVCAVPWQVVVV